MAIPAVAAPQTDFSAGEIDSAAKRDSKNPLVLAGVRQATNYRILNTKGMANRLGRRVLISGAYGRVDEVLMAPTSTFYLAFGNGVLTIFDSNGAQVFTLPGPNWTIATSKNITWDVYDKTIYFSNNGAVPLLVTWDGASTWTAVAFAEQGIGNQKRTLFYRLAPKSITMTVSALTGLINISFSAAVLVAGMVGTRIRFGGKQMTIASVTGPTTGTATVNETLITNRQNIASSMPTPAVGDVVSTASSGAIGRVAVTGAPFAVDLLSTVRFAVGDKITNGGATGAITAVSDAAPAPSVIWDQEVMNDYQGWPHSLAIDQSRLIFADFPALPAGIAWSAAVAFTDFYPDAFASDGLATDAIFELVPGKRRVQHVVPGMDASEFVFCDSGLLYIPITPANPLKPGSVTFNTISEDECGAVQPRRAGELIIYASGGLNQLMVVRIYGAYTRAYKTDSLTELSAHLFDGISAIAIMTASASFAERYLFVLNADGTVVVGKFSLNKSNDLEGAVGWTPWSGGGTVKWVSIKGARITFTTSYAPNAIAPVTLAEQLDDTLYLDAATLVNPPPTAMQQAQPPGTNVGNMTAGGGLAAAFDGVRSKGQAASAGFANVNGFVGRHFTTPQVIGQAIVWPSSDNGFVNGGTGNITIELRAKQTAPAAFNDGTLLKAVTLAANQTTPVVLVPDYDTTAWAYGFINIQRSGAIAVVCAQLLMQTGPLWWLAGGTVDLMDGALGTRMMGTYTIDANGNIIPQGLGGENLTVATLIAGQAWTAVLEPFLPPVQGGQDVGQRVKKRRIKRVQVNVSNSSGFLMQRLYSGQTGPSLPAPGTVMSVRRITTWNQGEDSTQPPTLREQSYLDRPLGRSHDPRWSVAKDTPGPLTIEELAFEITV